MLTDGRRSPTTTKGGTPAGSGRDAHPHTDVQAHELRNCSIIVAERESQADSLPLQGLPTHPNVLS